MGKTIKKELGFIFISYFFKMSIFDEEIHWDIENDFNIEEDGTWDCVLDQDLNKIFKEVKEIQQREATREEKAEEEKRERKREEITAALWGIRIEWQKIYKGMFTKWDSEIYTICDICRKATYGWTSKCPKCNTRKCQSCFTVAECPFCGVKNGGYINYKPVYEKHDGLGFVWVTVTQEFIDNIEKWEKDHDTTDLIKKYCYYKKQLLALK